MLRATTVLAAVALTLMPLSTVAEPHTLKLAFFTSDRTVAYQSQVKPFVDAINREGAGLIKIVVYASGALSKVPKEYPRLLLDGTADIAVIAPGQDPERFTNTAVIELPGLFRDAREATLTFTRLVAAGALAGYEDFFVIGAYAIPPEVINSRKPLRTLADLKGQRIRTNNFIQSRTLEMLGAAATVLPFNETTAALSIGTLDGAVAPPAYLFDVGVGRLSNYHYFLGTGAAPITLLMNRKKFDALPAAAKALIRAHSGKWTALRFIEANEAATKKALADIQTDPRRTVVFPSAADQRTAEAAFKSIIDDWAATSPHNRELLKATEAELAKIRSTP